MEQINYKLEVFEGPLDLLLSLISKHKLNINDIPIVELVDQYVAYVNSMQEADMYVASEFIEMAARLIYIKTVSLLPKYEEGEQLKEELQGELIAYKTCKEVAKKLSENTDGFNHFVRDMEKVEPDRTYTRFHEEDFVCSRRALTLFRVLSQRRLFRSVQNSVQFILSCAKAKRRSSILFLRTPKRVPIWSLRFWRFLK